MVAARSQGSRVEVLSKLSADSRTWANPDGSLTLEQDSGPVRVQQADGSWSDVDLTLALVNGYVTPKVSPVPFVASGGGSTTVASENLAGGTAQIGWDSPLPAPVLSGSTATYPDVRPGVDLVVQALTTGLEVNFVVHSQPSAPLSLPLTLSLKGLTAVKQKDGSLQIVDGSGHPVGRGGTPVMLGAPLLAGSTEPSTQRQVAASLSTPTPTMLSPMLTGIAANARATGGTTGGAGTTETWSLNPDPTFFTDPSVTYPVTIDPTVTLYTNLDTYVDQAARTTSFGSATRLKIGTSVQSGAYVKRSYIGFATPTSLFGMYISTAQLRLFNSYSSTCNATTPTVDVYGIDQAWSGSQTWDTRVTTLLAGGTRFGSAMFVHGGPAGESCATKAYDTIDVPGLIQRWADGTSDGRYAVQVSASSETDVHGYKEFYSNESGSGGVPALIVSYWAYPTSSAASVTPSVSNGSAAYVTNSVTPQLSADVTSSTGNAVAAHFYVYNSGGTLLWDLAGTSVAGTGTSTVTMPALTDGATYTVTTKGVTGGVLSKTASAPITVREDVTAPGAPTISSTAFTNGQWSYPASSNTFTLGQAAGTTDTTTYRYSEDGGTSVEIAASNGTASLNWNPGSGTHELDVVAKDLVGNQSAVSSFIFSAGPPAVSTVSQTQVTSTVSISASGPIDASSATLLYKPHASSTWTAVPAGSASLVLAGTTTAWTGAVSNVNGGSTTPSLVWRIPTDPAQGATVSSTNLPAPLSIDVQTCFSFPASPQSCSAPVTVQRVPHDTASVMAIGPGTVSLDTGEFSISATDSDAPGFTGSLGVGRTLLSFAAASGGPGHGFGPGWTTSVASPDGGHLDATLVDHTTTGPVQDKTMILTYPDGSADTYTDANWPTDQSSGAAFSYTGQGDADTSGTRLTLSPDELTLTVIDPDGTHTIFGRTTVTDAFTPHSVTEAQTNPTGGTGVGYSSTLASGGDSTLPTGLGVVAGDTWTATIQGAPGITCPTTITALLTDNNGAGEPGCKAMTVVTAGPGTAIPIGANTGPYPGQVREEFYTAFNPGKAGGAGMDNIVTAVFSYDAQGHLVSTYDPRADVTAGTHLITTYAYDGSNRVTHVTPPGLNPWTINYDTSGRLASVSRTDPANGPATTTVVYGVPLTGTGLPSMTATDVAAWGQPSTGAPVTAVAVFPPDHVPGATPSSTDWAYASLTYLDSIGNAVNTAQYGAAAWQVATTVRDTFDRTIRTLSPGNRAIALSGTGCSAQSLAPADVCALSAQDRASVLSNATVYSTTEPTEVTDTYGPAHTVTTAAGTNVTERAHTRTVYDEGAPSVPAGLGITRFRLPTTVTSSGYQLATTTPTSLTTGTDVDSRVTTNGYDPIDGALNTGPTSGWLLGKPTNVTTDKNGLNITSRTLFDNAGRVVQTRQPMSDGTDQGTRVTTYYTTTANATIQACGSTPQWDGAVCQTAQAGTGAAVPVTATTGYSMLMAPTTVTDTSGATVRTTTTSYDPAGRVTGTSTTETNGPTSDVPVPATTSTYYDTTGLPKTVATGGQTVTTSYDAIGRAVSQTDGAGNIATTGYDIDGRPLSVTDAKGTTTYAYDTLVDAQGVPTEHRGLVTGLDVGLGGGVPSVFKGFVYDAAGSLTSVTFPNDVVQADAYDPVGELATRSYTTAGAVTLLSWTRGYSAHGQVATETSPSSAGARSTVNAYDPAGRLVQVSDTLGGVCTVRGYGFNANSDRTRRSTWAGTTSACPAATLGAETTLRSGTFNSFDQLTATTVSGAGAGSGTYTYDALGRSASVPAVDVPGPTTTADVSLAYFTNDLIAVQTQGATSRTYALDALGRLASWVDSTGTGSTTTVNHYDGGGDSPAWTDTGTGTWTRQVTSPAGLLGLTATGATGSATATSAVMDLVSPHGDVIATIPDTPAVTGTGLSGLTDTDEYGNTLTGPAGVYGWVGGHNRITDITTGLIQMGVRLYNPTTGTFGSVDPVYAGNLTPYSYPADPIRGYDLDGRLDWSAIGGWISDHRGAIATVAASLACLAPVVGQVGCAAFQAAAFVVRSQQSIARKGWSNSWRGIVADGIVTAATVGLAGALRSVRPEGSLFSGISRSSLRSPGAAFGRIARNVTPDHVFHWAVTAGSTGAIGGARHFARFN